MNETAIWTFPNLPYVRYISEKVLGMGYHQISFFSNLYFCFYYYCMVSRYVGIFLNLMENSDGHNISLNPLLAIPLFSCIKYCCYCRILHCSWQRIKLCNSWYGRLVLLPLCLIFWQLIKCTYMIFIIFQILFFWIFSEKWFLEFFQIFVFLNFLEKCFL